MAYVGSIGSVNVLEFLSAELFDESQENPYLLLQANTSSYSPNSSLSKASVANRGSFSNNVLPSSITTELPLQDESSPVKEHLGDPIAANPMQLYFFQTPEVPVSVSGSTPVSIRGSMSPKPILKRKISVDSCASTMYSDCDSPMAVNSDSEVHKWSMSGSTPVSMRGSMSPKPILKRKISFNSCASTMYSDCDSPMAVNSDSEVHKLLHSLKSFGFASTCPPANPSTTNNVNGTMSSPLAITTADQNDTFPTTTCVEANCSRKKKQRSRCGKSKSSRKAGKKSRKVHRKGKRSSKNTSGPLADSTPLTSTMPLSTKRGSISYSAFQQCLRGGGGGSRLVRRDNPIAMRKKSMSTISSHLKRRQKFIRPTILTDAFNRVSDMRLGTKPLAAFMKHVAFPNTASQVEEYESPFEQDAHRLRRRLGRNSLIDIDTLDRIGSRAACPTQLLEEKAPNYSNVQHRVDSYNRSPRAERTPRRPSAWVLKTVDENTTDFQ